MKVKTQKFLIKILPLISIIIIWFIFSSPYFLKGKMPYSATYQVNNFAPWDAYSNLHGPVKNGAMPDVTTQIYPWKHFTIETWMQGQVPLWNPYSFGGTPQLANYQSAVLSPFNFLFFIFSFMDAWSLLILLQPLLAGLFMYMFLRSIVISKQGSIFGAISFMFCGFITVWMDYGTLAYAILFLPLALYSIEKFYQTKKNRYALFLALTIPLSFFSGHFQISIYFFLTVLLYQIYVYFQKRNISTALHVFFASICGILLSLPQVLPSLEFYTQSLRSNIFQKGETIPWAYLPTFLAPDFFGNPITRNDWFGHYAEWNAYVGIPAFLLSFYALKKKKSFILCLAIVSCIILLLAFPTPLLDLMIALRIPVISTSAVSRIIVIFSFLCITLAGFGFDALMHDMKTKNHKPIYMWILVSCLVFAILWLIILSKHFIPLDKISIAKQNFILPSSLFVTCIIPIIIGLSLIRRRASPLAEPRTANWHRAEEGGFLILLIGCLFILLTTFDMLRFAIKWQAFDPKQLAYIDVPVTSFFPRIAGYERVLGNFDASTAVYYHLPSLEGYDALYINRYGEFISSLSDGKLKNADRSVVNFYKTGPYTAKAINLLNVKYIVHKVSDDYVSWTFPYWNYPGNQFQKLFDDGTYRIYKNNAVFPRAFLVNSYVLKTDPQNILNTMFAKNFNLRRQIVLERNPEINTSNNTDAGSSEITHFTPNEMDISVNANSDSLLFTSDPYYNGWKATVDGKPTEILRADFAFRAVRIAQGKHTIKFAYSPLSFTIGVYVAIVGLLLLFSLLFLPYFSFFSQNMRSFIVNFRLAKKNK